MISTGPILLLVGALYVASGVFIRNRYAKWLLFAAGAAFALAGIYDWRAAGTLSAYMNLGLAVLLTLACYRSASASRQ